MRTETVRKALGVLILSVGFGLFGAGCSSAPVDEGPGNAFLAAVDRDAAAAEREARTEERLNELAAQVNRLTDAVVELLDAEKARLLTQQGGQ